MKFQCIKIYKSYLEVTRKNKRWQRGWYKGGNIYVVKRFKNGDRDGLCQAWEPNGKILARIRYRRGKLDGISRKWCRKQKKYIKLKYKQGIRL